MIEFDCINVNGFEAAFRGMRNPMNSWDESDSRFCIEGEDWWQPDLADIRDAWCEHYEDFGLSDEIEIWLWKQSLLDMDGAISIRAYIGPNDMNLAQRLIRAGSDEAKFMRQINVSIDITAPLYWWKEMDTYKVGTTANSTSTMHKLTSKEITINDFSFDKEILESEPIGETFQSIIKTCELLRELYLKTNSKLYWRALIQLLPESYNQTRTWTANYAVLRNIYFARRNHKLDEWRDFCRWIESLPYAKELICLEERKG